MQMMIIMTIMLAAESCVDPPTADRHGPLCDHGMIYAIAISPTRPLVVAAGRQGRSSNGRISVYDVASGKRLTTVIHVNGDYGTIRSLSFRADGEQIATTDEAGDLLLFGLGMRGQGESRTASLDLVRSVSLHATSGCAFLDEQRLAVGCADGCVCIVGMDKETPAAKVKVGEHAVKLLAVRSKLLAASSGQGGLVTVLNTEELRPVARLASATAEVTALCFLNESQLAVAYAMPTSVSQRAGTAERLARVRVWDLRSEEVIAECFVTGDLVTSVSISTVTTWAAIAHTQTRPTDGDVAVVIFDCASWKRVSRIEGPWRHPIAEFAPGEALLGVASGRTIEYWNLSDPRSPTRRWHDEWRWWDDVKGPVAVH